MSDEIAQVTEAPVVTENAVEAAEVSTDNAESIEKVEPAEELIEVERNGKRYQLPKELNDELLMRSDYSRKTQELAEQRRQFEQQTQSEKQAIEQQRQAVTVNRELAATLHQLDEYSKVTPEQWQQYMQQDPATAQSAFMKMQALRDKAGQLQNAVQQDEQRRAFEKQQQSAKSIEQALTEVKAAIPDWSDAKDQELGEYARKSLGAPENAQGLPAWVIKAVHKASLYDKSMKTATAPTPSPVPTAIRTISGAARASVDPAKLGINDWMKYREKQLRGR